MVIFFDILGTLFSLERARQKFVENELGRELFDLWFARLLQTGFAASLAGHFIPFREVALATLRQVVPMEDGVDEMVARLMEGMQQLQPAPEALKCLRTLRDQDHRVCAVTNGSDEATQALMSKNGLSDYVHTVVSINDAAAWKPHPKAYNFALERCGVRAAEACLVTAHAWDAVGAAAVGMRTVWVSRQERRWAFPGEAPGLTVPTLAEVPEAVAASHWT